MNHRRKSPEADVRSFRWYWISYVKRGDFLGVIIVAADNSRAALDVAWAMGAPSADHIWIFPVPPEVNPRPWSARLLDRRTLHKAGLAAPHAHQAGAQ